jgi:replicative DNA helicase
MTIHPISDPNLEQCLLSHFFSDPSQLDDRKLRAELFTLPRNKKLYEALKKLRQQGEPISADGVRLIDIELEDEAKKLSLRRLGDLTTKTVIKRLVEMSKRREMQDVAAQLNESAVSADDPDAAVSEQLSRLMATESDDEETCRSVGDANRLIDTLEWRSMNPGKIRGLSSGFTKLDKITDGFHSGFSLICGRSSDGKSTIAMNFAVNIAENLLALGDSRQVYFGSYEMDHDDLLLRIASSISRQPMSEGGLTNAEMRVLGETITKMKRLPLVIDDKSHPAISYVMSRIRKLHREKGLAFAVIDYLQLVKNHKSKGDKVSDIDFISKELQGLSRELHIPILGVVMLKRAEKQWDKAKQKWFIPPPLLSDIKGSSSPEEDAQLVMLVYRDNDNNTFLQVSKNRFGLRNVEIPMIFEAATYNFREKDTK